MRKSSLTLIALVVGLLPWEAQAAAPVFDAHFRADATLRIDYVHTGNHSAEEFNLDGFVREGAWPGRRRLLVDASGYGKHRVELRATGSGELIYSQGYASLFSEWQTTSEARGGMRRAFHESVRLPWPKATVTVSFASRDASGRFQELLRFDVDPSLPTIQPARYDEGHFPLVVLQEVAGGPDQTLDVLVVGDGYTAAEMDKYRRDLDRFARRFFETRPFRDRRDVINLRALEVVSQDSGPDEPRKGLLRDTALSTTFDTFGSARYLTTTDNDALRDIAATAPYDTLFILVNTSRYGGAGVYGQFSIFPSDNEYDEYVMIHEFGHGFGGLGDEYYSSGVAYEEFYPAGVEPWEPNITALLDPAKPKWGDLVEAGVPCPTPADATRYGHGRVGCFEGAGYQAKGLYRPALTCTMFAKGAVPFCPVCARALLEQIDRETGR